MSNILSWFDPTSWMFRIIVTGVLVLLLSFGWLKFKLYIAEPYIQEVRVEMQHTIDAHISEKQDIQSKLDSVVKVGALEKERQTIQAKTKEIIYKKEIANAKTELEDFKNRLSSNNTSLDSLRNTSDRVLSSCTAGSGEFATRIADAHRASEADVREAISTAADAVGIAKEAIAAANALQK